MSGWKTWQNWQPEADEWPGPEQRSAEEAVGG